MICLFSLAATLVSAASVKDLEMDGWLSADTGDMEVAEEDTTTDGSGEEPTTTPTVDPTTESTTTGAASSVISFTILSACLLAKFIS